ncbi:MAG: hypothetical protein R3349_11040, partial [Geminicoccaceae bacterium]|nr:hypothetical protein [Geminicoccaceae bacterium]
MLPPVAAAHTPHDAIFDVALSSQYPDDRVVFTLVRSSVYRSDDGGATWRRLIHGLDHKHTLFDFDVADDGRTLFVTSLGDGVYRSGDGVATWAKANTGLATLNVDQVLIAEGAPDVVLASGTTGGVFMTRDGGGRWQRLDGPFGKATALAFLPQRDDALLVGDNDGGLYLSEDGGASWRPLALPEQAGAVTAIALAPDAAEDPTLIVGTKSGRVFVAADPGSTLAPAETAFTDQPIVAVALSPGFAADGVAFATAWDDGVFCSRDGARTWELCIDGLTTDHQSQQLGRPSFGALSVSSGFATDQTVLVGGFDGLFRSTDGGRDWEELDT